MKAARQVVVSTMIVIMGSGVLSAQSNELQRLDATNTLKSILLVDRHVGEMSAADEIKKCLIRPGVMHESNVVAVLTSWTSAYTEHTNRWQRLLGAKAIYVLGAFPSEPTRQALLAIVNGASKDERCPAAVALVKSSPGLDLDKILEGVWFSSLGAGERLSIYQAYIGKAEAMTNKVEDIPQFVAVMERLWENHSNRCDEFFLDRYMTKKIPSHRMTPSRQAWLNKLKESDFEDVRKYAEQELGQKDK